MRIISISSLLFNFETIQVLEIVLRRRQHPEPRAAPRDPRPPPPGGERPPGREGRGPHPGSPALQRGVPGASPYKRGPGWVSCPQAALCRRFPSASLLSFSPLQGVVGITEVKRPEKSNRRYFTVSQPLSLYTHPASCLWSLFPGALWCAGGAGCREPAGLIRIHSCT